MADDNTTPCPLKVFIWTYPRTVSTTLLKCVTYVPNSVVWFEPYQQIAKFSNHIEDPNFSHYLRDLVEDHGGKSEVAKIESGFDADDKDFDWLKDQLESDLPDKNLVFVKAMAHSIVRESRYDKIPNGFRHTFLIRNPEKLVKSHERIFLRRRKPGAFKNPALNPVKANPVRDLNKLWKYVQAQGLESQPVIIDIDELLESPKEMLEAYCNEIGIPFTENLLTWPAGDDVMTKMWMVPKQTILTFPTVGMHDVTFASTGFHKGADSSKEDEELSKQTPVMFKLMFWALTKWKVYTMAPYYKEMFARRLTPGNHVVRNAPLKANRVSSDSIFPLLAGVCVCLLAMHYILFC